MSSSQKSSKIVDSRENIYRSILNATFMESKDLHQLSIKPALQNQYHKGFIQNNVSSSI